MSKERIAKRYAQALLDLCEGDLSQARAYYDQIAAVASVFELPELRKLLQSPVVSKDVKSAALKNMSEQLKADRLASLFLDAIADANRVGLIPDIAKALKAKINEADGVAEAEISTVIDLTPSDLEAVRSKLEPLIGKKLILNPTVDKSILGGFVVRVGTNVLDMSLKTKLNAMTKTALS